MNQKPSKMHVYGKSAALTIEACENSKNDFFTVMFEIAPSDNGTADWTKKIAVQPTSQELPSILAVFLGYAVTARIKRDQKWLEVTAQGDRVFFKGGYQKPYALPIAAGDRVGCCALLLQEYSRNYPDLQPALIIASLQSIRTPSPRSSG